MYTPPKLPPPLLTEDGRDLSSHASLLRAFKCHRRLCMWCQIDYVFQTYGIGGGRASLVCSDRCDEQMFAERARVKVPPEVIDHARTRVIEEENRDELPDWVG